MIGNLAALFLLARLGGTLVCELFLVAAAAVWLSRGLPSRTAMLLGVALLVPSAALLVAAQGLRSLELLIAGAAATGAAAALGYRGSLHVVNEMAPGGKRAELISSYQIVCFLGNSLPVVGVGVLSAAATPFAATVSLALCIALLAALALATELRRGRQPGWSSVRLPQDQRRPCTRGTRRS